MKDISLQDRSRVPTPRERLFLALGGAAILLFILFLMLPSEAREPPIELAQPPAVAPPPPMPYVSAAPPAAPAASASGLALKGVLASGAIIGWPDGGERFVPLGREFLPGLTLKEVGVLHVVLATSGGDVRLELGRSGATAVAAAPAPAAVSGTADRQQRTLALRIGLAKRESDGNVTGYTLKRGADVPVLQRAGLRAGDVLIAINGQAIDGDERLFGIPDELAGAESADIEYERDGQRMAASVPLG